MPTQSKIDRGSLDRERARRLRGMREKSRSVLDRVGERTVEILESLTNERNKRGSLVHPGGWGDRTGTLASKFYYRVDRRGEAFVLEIGNTARHAHLVEAVDGMFVVRGIAEDGGIAAEAFKRAVGEIAPDWAVT